MTDIERFEEFCEWFGNHVEEVLGKVVENITRDFVTADDLELGVRKGELNGKEQVKTQSKD